MITFLRRSALAVVFLTIIGGCVASNKLPTLWLSDPSATEQNDVMTDLIAGDIALHRNKPSMAQSFYSHALEQSSNADIARLSFSAAMKTNQRVLITQTARTLLELDPNAKSAHLALMLNAVMEKDANAVTEQVQAMYDNSQNKASFIAGLANTFTVHDDNIDVEWLEPILQPYLDAQSEHAEVLMAMAKMRLFNKDRKGACRLSSAAVEKKPADGRYVSFAADACWSVNPQEAQKIMQSYLAKEPANGMVRLMYARSLLRMHKSPEALKQVRRAVKDNADNPGVLYNSGQVAMEAKEPKLAVDYYKQYLVSKESSVTLAQDPVWLRLAEAYHALKDYSREAQALGNYKRGPQYRDARLREADCYLNLNRPEQALQVLTPDEKNAGNDTAVFTLAKAQILMRLHKPQTAYDTLRTALAHDKNNVDLLYEAAMVAEHLKQTDQAKQYLKDVLAIVPEHVQANNALGYIILEHGGDKKQARRYIETAYRLAPLDPYVLDSMGWLSYKDGLFDQAIEFTKTALIKKFNSDSACHLLEALHAAGRRQEAQALTRELLMRLPNNEDIKKTVRRLGLEVTP